MFAKMKTGTKVLTGFGLAMLVAVIVGLVGYAGIAKVSGHNEEIGMVRLPSVQSLLELRVGGEQITAAQCTLARQETGVPAKCIAMGTPYSWPASPIFFVSRIPPAVARSG